MQIPKFIKDIKKYFMYEGSATPTTQDDLQAYMKNEHETLECLVDGLWQPETEYQEGHIVRSPNMAAGFIAVAKNAGYSATNEPDWNTTAREVIDGSITWIKKKQDSGVGSWEASKEYKVNDTVQLANNSAVFLLCTTSGISAVSEPVVTSQSSVTDGSVTWKVVAYNKVAVLNSNDLIEGKNIPDCWKSNESVAVGTIRFLSDPAYAGYYLKCVQAGTTGSNEPTNVDSGGDFCIDGTAKWLVYSILKSPDAFLLGGQTAAQIIANTLGQVPKGISVSVTAGTIGNGGTIPLPSGYTRAQCKYAVWPTSISVYTYATSTARPTISVNQNNGVVSYGGNYSNSEPAGGGSVTGAGYLCIAVK